MKIFALSLVSESSNYTIAISNKKLRYHFLLSLNSISIEQLLKSVLKNSCFKNFSKFQRKHLCHCPVLTKVAGLKPAILKVVLATFLLVFFVCLKESTFETRKMFLLHFESSFHS